MSRGFLHPSQRSLKTEQIGPSGHKNQYHVATLEGNWFEERRGFGPQLQKNAENTSFSSTTTQRVSYVDFDEDARKGAKLAEACSQEAPRELLFQHGGHGLIQSQFSTTELSYRSGTETALSYKEIISTEGVSPRRSRSNAKKAEAAYGLPEEQDDSTGGSASDCRTITSDGKVRYHLPPIGVAMTRDRFTTSKNVTIDATGAYLREHLADVYTLSSATKSRGSFTRSLNNVMHGTHLRL